MAESTPSSPPSRHFPHNLDAERAVLGAILLDNEVLVDVSQLIGAEDFYLAAHQTIYKRILELYENGNLIDLTALCDRLAKSGELDQAGSYVYLASLEQYVLATSSAGEHAQIVRGKSILRQLMRAAETILDESSQEKRDIEAQIEDAERLIYQVSQQTEASKFQLLEDLMQLTLSEIGQLYETKEPSGGLPTSFVDLDRLLGGFEPTALIILAARPSIGKTAFALNIVRNIAKLSRKAVAFFSLEMGAEQLNMRLLCTEAQISSQKIKRGFIREDEWMKLRGTASEMMDWPIFIDDAAALPLLQVRSRARRLKSQRNDLGLIVVDYLQLMQAPAGRREVNRQQEVAEISRGLKALAKELQTPVLALSQLSRNIEQRSGKERSARPMLSDLRESGAIEQDADVVLFIHRDRLELQPKDSDSNRKKNEPIPTEIIVGKNRNGPVGTAELLFWPEITRFTNIVKQDAEA